MTPIVNGLAQEYAGRLHVIAMNALGEGKPAFEYFRLAGHPSYVVLKPDGARVWSAVGVRSRAELVDAIAAAQRP